MNVKESVLGFLQQASRIISITSKPKANIYRQMALTTAIGIVIIGLFGFIIAMIFAFGGF
ncbi:MAG: protein translocase SEC61 complex subunit gamma [Candidatus Micrarchaeota archaeon]